MARSSRESFHAPKAFFGLCWTYTHYTLAAVTWRWPGSSMAAQRQLGGMSLTMICLALWAEPAHQRL